ncbi:MAG: CDP-diacylglycerol--glycerol-3-phosphate 3-phosphatidyltransferase [Chloroflexi bacterium RBG_13_54_9]|nr:MAG: CDP-diacylglycerol--glycerol-3-phosphate 3-phosphatidyltransferase [Chloroflexi bacterium RBG_13_54_9]
MITDIRRTWPRRLTEPVARLVAKTGLSPNTLTVLGLFLNLGVAAIIATGHTLVGGLMVLFAGAFDLLDGTVARLTQRSTRFGALLDSTLDRLSDAALLFGLLILYVRQHSSGEILLVYIALVGSMMVSYTRARAEGLQLECEVGLLARGERVVILALGLIFNQVIIALWILAVLTSITAAQRVFYVWQKTKGK